MLILARVLPRPGDLRLGAEDEFALAVGECVVGGMVAPDELMNQDR
jgi:hypothetical protein